MKADTFQAYADDLTEFIRNVALHDDPDEASAALAFDRFAMRLFALQFEANALLQRLCQHRGVHPERIRSWREIPAISTTAFKEFDITDLRPDQRLFRFESSGTTEQRPSRHFHDGRSLALYEESVWPWFAAHVLARSEAPTLWCFLTPPPSDAPHSSLVHMFDVIRRRVGPDTARFYARVQSPHGWLLELDQLHADLIDVIKARTPVALLGAAFSFVELCDGLAARHVHLTLPRGSRVMETGGYKGRSRALPKSDLYALIAHRLGITTSQIVSEYGMCELSSQAYDGRVGDPIMAEGSDRRRFRFPPWARARLVSPETGREVDPGGIGLVEVVDLANLHSAIAIQTQDLARAWPDGFEWVGRASVAEARGCSLMVSSA